MARVIMKATRAFTGAAAGDTFSVTEAQARAFEADGRAERVTAGEPAKPVVAKKVAKKATYRRRDMRAAD